MAMPAPTIELYSAAGGWGDVSNYVLMTEGLRATRGRATQWDTSSTGTLTLTFDNSDWIFTPSGSNNYYGYGKNTPIRVKISGYQVWTGFIDSIEAPLIRGSKQVARVTGSDRFKFYAKTLLDSFGVEFADYALRVGAAATAGALYPLAESKLGYGTFWTAHRQPTVDPIRIYGALGGSHAFTEGGGTTAPPFLNGSIRLFPDDSSQAPVLEHPTSFDPGSEKAAVSLWFKVEQPIVNDVYLFYMLRTSGGTGYFSCKIEQTNGDLRFNAAADSGGGSINHSTTKTGLNDGAWHHLVVYVNQTTTNTTLNIYIDGVSDSTHTSSVGKITIGSTNRRIVFGGTRNTGWTNNTYCLPGLMACIGVFKYSSTPTSTYFTDIYGAGMNGMAGDSLSTRTDRLAKFVGATSPAVANGSGFTVSGQETGGKSYLQAIQEIAESDFAIFYMDRLGDPKYRSSGARTSSASVTLTLDADKDLSGDLVLQFNDGQFANTVTATSPAGGYTKQNSTSVTSVGPIVDRFECLASTEALLQTQATTRLNARLNENPRVQKATIDLLTTANSIAATTVQLVPLDRVRISNVPTGWTPGGTSTFDGFVEGWELAISDQSYTVSLDLSPIP